jgi:alginate O-acetyltransferase complex protein AlgI
MVFNSPTFLFLFLPGILILYYLLNNRLKNCFLLIASLFFYAWGEPKYVLLLLLSILVNYLFGILINASDILKIARKVCLWSAVAFNVWILVYFKYTNFLLGTANGLLGGNGFAMRDIALPLGISFYSFQILTYIIDLYRDKVPVEKNLFDFALYVSLFPKLVMGPITRYADVHAQLKQRKESPEYVYRGLKRFAVGFSKKVLLSDTVALLANTAFGMPAGELSIGMAWIGIISYTLQIYFDFSGYSDMAIGLGQIFGFDFRENFNYPYISVSIQDFWRRWHISLSSWFRDYVYFPLGGSRCSKAKVYRNILFIFLLTGIWHGANWTFIIWGLYHGVFLTLERGKWGEILNKLPGFWRHFYTLIVVMIGWVMFRVETLGDAVRYIACLFGYGGSGTMSFAHASFSTESLFFAAVGVLFSMPLAPKCRQKLNRLIGEQWTEGIGTVCTMAVFGLAFCYMVTSGGYSPFIYFNF